MIDTPHTHCSLRSKKPAELTTLCAQAVDHKDWREAFHTAQHHMITCHNGVSSDQVDFFTDRVTGLSQITEDFTTALLEGFSKGMEEAMESEGFTSAPFMLRMQAQRQHMVVMASVQGFMTGAYVAGLSMGMYVASRGTGCLFSAVDAELCTRAIDE